jgi:NADPH2:quinone reductase
MKAAVIADNGVEIRDVPTPQPKPNEVLVAVRASGLNRADLLMAAGSFNRYSGGSDVIAGLEWAGDVVAVGTAVRGLSEGDRVMCSGSGGYAEFAVADWGRALPIPANNMTYEQAAALPVALGTMHNAVVTAGRCRAGESILVQGASSGVGLMALQIAKFVGAGLVIGTSTNAARRARLSEFGADLTLDSTAADWADMALEATNGQGVDLIIDQVSASVANENMKAAKILGRIVNVGRLGGAVGEFDFDLHALKRLDYIGVTFRTRSVEEIRSLTVAMRTDLWDAVADGTLSLPIDRVFPLDDAAAAQAHMAENAHFGKIVLQV